MPLENLLGPLIARHAAELAQQVEPQPQPVGYLRLRQPGMGMDARRAEPVNVQAQQRQYPPAPPKLPIEQQIEADVKHSMDKYGDTSPQGPGVAEKFYRDRYTQFHLQGRGVGAAVGKAAKAIKEKPVEPPAPEWREVAPGHFKEAGYLNIGNPRDNGMPKQEPKLYDPRMLTPQGSAALAAGTMMSSPDAGVRAMGKAYLQRLDAPPPSPMPNVPVQNAEPAKPAPRKGRIIIKAEPGEPMGISEDGQAVDARGRKMGYLDQETMNPGIRYLDRRPSDLNLDATAGNIIRDDFARKNLERTYGPHLKAMEDNRDADGMPTDKFPDGYFDGKSKADRENIMKGVKKLREVQKLEERGSGGSA